MRIGTRGASVEAEVEEVEMVVETGNGTETGDLHGAMQEEMTMPDHHGGIEIYSMIAEVGPEDDVEIKATVMGDLQLSKAQEIARRV